MWGVGSDGVVGMGAGDGVCDRRCWGGIAWVIPRSIWTARRRRPKLFADRLRIMTAERWSFVARGAEILNE